MNKKKSILIAVPRVPYPLDAGGKIAIYSVIEELSKHFNVHLVIITDAPITNIQIEAMLKISTSCKIFYFSKIKCKINSLKSIYNKKPLQTNYFYFQEVQKYVDKISVDMDAYYSFMIRTSAYLARINKYKVINFIDSLFLSYLRSSAKTTSILWKIIYKYEITALQKYERECIENFDANIFVNSVEASYWSKFSNNIHCLPFGIEQAIIEYDKVDKKYSNCIVFFGKMDYQPNVDAVQWFCNNILLKLPPKIKFIIIGASPSKEIIELTQKYNNIEVTGFIEDPYAMIRACLAVVAPMQTGGGLQTKVLVSMALGALVLAPKWVIEPIPGAVIGENIIAAETPDDYIRNIINIFQNPSNFTSIGNNAREVARNKFSWTHYQKENLSLFESIS